MFRLQHWSILFVIHVIYTLYTKLFQIYTHKSMFVKVHLSLVLLNLRMKHTTQFEAGKIKMCSRIINTRVRVMFQGHISKASPKNLWRFYKT